MWWRKWACHATILTSPFSTFMSISILSKYYAISLLQTDSYSACLKLLPESVMCLVSNRMWFCLLFSSWAWCFSITAIGEGPFSGERASLMALWKKSLQGTYLHLSSTFRLIHFWKYLNCFAEMNAVSSFLNALDRVLKIITLLQMHCVQLSSRS
jgi:hypothetical protein